MKRFFGILATVAIAIVAPSCDDGPTSTYSVLPAGQNAANGGAGVPTVDLIPKQKLGTSTAGVRMPPSALPRASRTMALPFT